MANIREICVCFVCLKEKKHRLIFKSPNIGMSRKNSILFSFLLVSMWSCLRNECTGTIYKVRDWKMTLPEKMSCSWHSQTSVFTSHILKLGSCPHVLLLCMIELYSAFLWTLSRWTESVPEPMQWFSCLIFHLVPSTQRFFQILSIIWWHYVL